MTDDTSLSWSTMFFLPRQRHQVPLYYYRTSDHPLGTSVVWVFRVSRIVCPSGVVHWFTILDPTRSRLGLLLKTIHDPTILTQNP